MNKTPRQLLLDQNRAVEPRLDACRRHVLAEFVEARAASDEAARPAIRPAENWLARAWRELFWDGRRVWGGLAAAWVVIVLVNASLNSQTQPSRSASTIPAESWQEMLQLQQRFLADLSDAPVAVPPPAPAVPRPRSERREAQNAFV